MTAAQIATSRGHGSSAAARDRLGLHPLLAVLAAGAIVLELVRIANLFLSVFEGGRLAVLCAVTTTIVPTRALFAAEALGGVDWDIALVPGAWDLFKAGDMDAYHGLIADAADAAFTSGATVVALAQSSMSGAAARARRGTPLTSPNAAFAALR